MLHQLCIAQQVNQRVGKAFGLQQLRTIDLTAGTNNGITWTDQCVDVMINRPHTLTQFASEAVMHADKAGFPGFTHVQIRKQLPDGN